MAVFAALTAALIAPAQSASATNSLVATPTTTVLVTPGATTPLLGMNISGDATDTLEATIATDNGTITIPTTSGSVPGTTTLVLAYGNSWSGTASLSFTGTQADIDIALATARLASPTTGTAHVSLTANVSQTNYNFASPNGHFYQYVSSPGISWFDADTAAKALSFGGQPGYLATIPTAAINTFISTKISGATDIWFGARAYESGATDGTATYATYNGTSYARVWRWTVGSDESPIAGNAITACTADNQSSSSCTTVAPYAGWVYGEPNDARGTLTPAYNGEYVGVTNWGGGSGNWNDIGPTYQNDLNNINGYVVEYGGKTNTNDASLGTGFGNVVTSTTTVQVASSATVPAAPVLTGTPGNGQTTLTWPAPATGGSAITSYQYSPSSGSSWYPITPTATTSIVNGQSVTTETAVLSPLTNGTAGYWLVRAVNSVGAGAQSNGVTVTPGAVPTAPTAVVATRGNASASVVFSAPSNIGGFAISTYTATATPGGATTTCSSSPCAFTGLTNGTAYTFTVHATNAVGDGAESAASAAVTPATVPGVPTGVTATRADGGASVAFTAPATNGDPISGYTVTSTPAGSGGATTSCSSSPCAIAGLTNGTSYTFVVHATNGVGSGTDSSASTAITPATVPGAPTGVTATRANASASVAFTAPVSTGGATIASYTVTSSPGSLTATCATSPCVVTGLTNGTAYTFTVRATNSVSSGSPSSPSVAVTPATVPGVPTGVSAARGNASAVVTFVAPSANGDAITGYTVTRSPGAVTSACASSPCTITGLTNGSAYTFTVHATNTVGDSSESAASGSVTPGAVAGAPTVTSVVGGPAQATVSFTPPGSTGGFTITGYHVIASPGGATATCTSSPCTVGGLTNGTSYTLAVSAVTAMGDGTPAVSAAVVPATVPGAPGSVAASSLDGGLRIRWSAPTDTGGAAITGYRLSVSPGGGTVSCANSPCTIPGLANGTAYTVRVIASNAVGDGAAASTSGTPAGIPAAPTGLSVLVQNGGATLTFTAPDNRGAPITSYEVSTDGGIDWQTATTSGSGPLTITVTGLTNGVPVDLQVRARNSVGAGLAADPGSLTPATTPGAATSLTALAEPSAVSLSWHQPTIDGGSAIIGYTVTATPGGQSCATIAATQCTIRSLTNGTRYTFTVVATNAMGESLPSAVASATPIATPGAPSGVVASGGRGAATVTFVAPVDTGGSTVTGYVVRGGPAVVRCEDSPCRVAELTDGTSYRFTVAAVNAAGTGPRSAASNDVTPADLPGAPTHVRVTSGDGTATLTFTAPDDNGSPIDHFQVSTDGGATWRTIAASGSDTITVTLGLLPNGRRSGVVVRGVNAVGHGAASAVRWVTPAGASASAADQSAAPTNVVVTPRDGGATVSFGSPGSTGAVVVTIEPGGRRVTCASSPCTIDGLRNGTAYRLSVSSGDTTSPASVLSSTSVRPMATPLVLGTPTVTPVRHTVLVSWGAPVTMPNVKVTGYTVTASPGGATCMPTPVTATSCLMRGLTTGRVYSFRVSVHATGGHSAVSARSRSIVLASLVAPHAPPTAAASVLPTLLPIMIGAVLAILVITGLWLLLFGRARRRKQR